MVRLDLAACAAAVMLGPLLVGPISELRAEDNAVRELPETNRSPKTLFEWALGSDPKDTQKGKAGEEDRLDSDRPHFPEATTTVGEGRAIFESGYTFTKKGETFLSHSYPEALLRIGMFADWFELRIGQNFANQRQTVDGVPTNMSGAQDLYLGMKLALTEQKGILPQVVIIPQMTVPTGSEELTAGRILPGLNVDCSWEVIRHFFRIELLIANNFVQDISTQNTGFQLATGLTAVFELTRSLEMFIEWDAFYPMGRISSDGPRDYAVGGFVYFLTPNLALDARAGVGLNSRSNDFLAGVGFAVRR
jgi:hypothetical protein